MLHYIELFGARLDGRRFVAIPLAGDAKEIRDVRTRRMHDTAAGT